MADTPPRDDKLTGFGRALTIVESDRFQKRGIIALAVICVLLFMADFVYHRHAKFAFEEFPGFYAIYGFAAFAFIVFSTKGLKRLINRREDYYGPGAGIEAEDYPAEQTDVRNHTDA